ncbi:MAG: heparinase II/III family protein [Coriobacteriales bacterium]|jgi:uncharacterized heparinase superfamily protein|nr:heparinase II/III family protein [Coriobacteriales bacterium]
MHIPLRRGYSPNPDVRRADISRIPVLPELDFDPVFLGRFDCDAILADELTLLHHTEKIDWQSSWSAELSTPLWRYNLHYHEYLLPLADKYLRTLDRRYLEKAKQVISSWINANGKVGAGSGWDSYTISMRLINWLSFYGEIKDEIEKDEVFLLQFNESLAEQYRYLGTHLEKDLLANHYLENLKALVIGALYFDDMPTLALALPLFNGQLDEQILSDGMHFELSPMYHKVILEDVLRVASAREANDHATEGTSSIRCHLQDMCDCLHSLERHTARTPLFNDSGDNVAKHKDALLACAKTRFGIVPGYKDCLSDAGYYLIEREVDGRIIKLVFDAGAPGPSYALGHAHCDALSLECFIDEQPWIVNCGTYAYQDERRLEYKKTLSHSTVRAADCEQSECWGAFRVARFAGSQFMALQNKDTAIVAKGRMRDFRGHEIERTIRLSDQGLEITDEALGDFSLLSALILSGKQGGQIFDGATDIQEVNYAPEFGYHEKATRVLFSGTSPIEVKIPYNIEG